jgi:hypothetical protein
MSDDFGLTNLVGSPFLERISREERLSDELPRKHRNLKTGDAKKKTENDEPDESQKDENSITSHLIDLRI